jgi:hypothetical protein
MGVILAVCGGALAAFAVALLLLCCYCRVRRGSAAKAGTPLSKRNQLLGSTLSERAVLEAERLVLVQQMCAAAAAVGGLYPISDPPPSKLTGKRGVPKLPPPSGIGNRFASVPSELVFGRPAEAALGTSTIFTPTKVL